MPAVSLHRRDEAAAAVAEEEGDACRVSPSRGNLPRRDEAADDDDQVDGAHIKFASSMTPIDR